MTGVLSLDISKTSTGWAAVSSPLPRSQPFLAGKATYVPRFGAWPCPKEVSPGIVGIRFSQFIQTLIEEFKPDVIVFERPIHAGSKTSFDTARILYGLAFVAEVVAAGNEIPIYEVHQATWKAHFCANGHAKKDEVKRVALAMGWDVVTYDEADACAILDYAVDMPAIKETCAVAA